MMRQPLGIIMGHSLCNDGSGVGMDDSGLVFILAGAVCAVRDFFWYKSTHA